MINNSYNLVIIVVLIHKFTRFFNCLYDGGRSLEDRVTSAFVALPNALRNHAAKISMRIIFSRIYNNAKNTQSLRKWIQEGYRN